MKGLYCDMFFSARLIYFCFMFKCYRCTTMFQAIKGNKFSEALSCSDLLKWKPKSDYYSFMYHPQIQQEIHRFFTLTYCSFPQSSGKDTNIKNQWGRVRLDYLECFPAAAALSEVSDTDGWDQRSQTKLSLRTSQSHSQHVTLFHSPVDRRSRFATHGKNKARRTKTTFVRSVT